MAEPRREELTTQHVRRAVAGDPESVAWLVERFAPLLLAQARLRLPKELHRIVEPEDLVQDAWAVALPRLRELPPRDGRYTPVVLRFLCTTILYRVSNLMQRQLERTLRAPTEAGSAGSMGERSGLSQLAADESMALTKAMRSEASRLVLAAIDGLDEEDRKIVVMRGIENAPTAEVAALLGMKPNTVTVRYRRLLQRLRESLPSSIFDEFETPPAD